MTAIDLRSVYSDTTQRRVELRCYRHFADATQFNLTFNSTSSCVAIGMLSEGVYSDTTQLNSTDPVEQRTANQARSKSVVFLFMTS